MRNFIYIITIFMLAINAAFAQHSQGGVTKVGQEESNQVIDAQTKNGLNSQNYNSSKEISNLHRWER